MNDELRNMWKVMHLCICLGAEENREKLQYLGYPVFMMRFQPKALEYKAGVLTSTLCCSVLCFMFTAHDTMCAISVW
jgi:hypothetical protein